SRSAPRCRPTPSPAWRPTTASSGRRRWRARSSGASRSGRTGSSSGPTPPVPRAHCAATGRDSVAPSTITACRQAAMTVFNAATYLLGRHLDQGRADHPAVRGTTTATYAELDELVGDVAAAYGILGLHRDDRVMIVGTDYVPMLAAILGAFRAGVVAVPVSTM